MSPHGPETNTVASTITSPQSAALHQAGTISFQWTISDMLRCRRLVLFPQNKRVRWHNSETDLRHLEPFSKDLPKKKKRKSMSVFKESLTLVPLAASQSSGTVITQLAAHREKKKKETAADGRF